MKARSEDFKNQIKELGREISSVISIYANDLLATQDSKVILTQDDMELIANVNTSVVDYEITEENIINTSIIQKGNILSAMMKEFDFESDLDLKVGTILNYKFGIKVNNSNEYLNYGDFIVYKKEFNEDTKTYNYVCYDSMLKTMIMVDDTSIIENTRIGNALNHIADKFGLEISLTDEILNKYSNLNKTIPGGIFTNIEMTYRDVLDQICQAIGVSIYVNGNELLFKGLNTEIVDTIDSTYLKDTNITFKEKYGPINSLVLSRSEDSDNIYRQDEESIEENGLHEFKIKDNLILLGNDREEFIDNIFNQIKGLEFYINDYESTGICYLDWLDFYNVTIDENTYKCLMLNDEIKIKQGISENVYTEQPEESVSDYTTIGMTDKEVSFIVDKQNAAIKSKVSQDEMQSAIEQTASQITAQVNQKVGNNEVVAKLNLAVQQGQGIVDLSGNVVKITSDHFTLDANGNVTATNGNFSGTITSSNATITGGSMNITTSGKNNILTLNNSTYGTTIGVNGNEIKIGNSTIYYSSLNESQLYLEDGSYKAIYDSTGFSFIYNNNSSIEALSNVGTIYANNFIPNSKEILKKNIKSYNNALEQILNTDIYTYNFKTEDDNEKKHIGFVIGENRNYSKDIVAIRNGEEIGVDLYSFVSVCCKAIQEQQEEIDLLKEEIRLLKEAK